MKRLLRIPAILILTVSLVLCLSSCEKGPNPPVVTTASVSAIANTSATAGGNVTDDGGAAVTRRGICYSTTENPTISDNRTADGSGNGSFTSSLTSLTPDTEYYVRAYASNSVGTAYGDQVTFATLQLEVVTDIDGNTYHAVIIGTQVWMVENLKTTKYNDGTEIPQVEGEYGWDRLSADQDAYCWYENDSANGDPYGILYTWAAAMNGAASSDASPSGVQGVCPDGWHLPSDAEWTTLISYLGEKIAANKLKEAGNEHWVDYNSDATNETGFTALPGGIRYLDGSFTWPNTDIPTIGESGYWWSTSEHISEVVDNRVYGLIMSMSSPEALKYICPMAFGMSVRCLKD